MFSPSPFINRLLIFTLPVQVVSAPGSVWWTGDETVGVWTIPRQNRGVPFHSVFQPGLDAENNGKYCGFRDPVFFNEKARVSPRQEGPTPVMLVSKRDFQNYLVKDVNIAGGFGASFDLDAKVVINWSTPRRGVPVWTNVSAIEWVPVWKFPAEIQRLPGFKKQNNHLRDAVFPKAAIENNPQPPIGQMAPTPPLNLAWVKQALDDVADKYADIENGRGELFRKIEELNRKVEEFGRKDDKRALAEHYLELGALQPKVIRITSLKEEIEVLEKKTEGLSGSTLVEHLQELGDLTAKMLNLRAEVLRKSPGTADKVLQESATRCTAAELKNSTALQDGCLELLITLKQLKELEAALDIAKSVDDNQIGYQLELGLVSMGTSRRWVLFPWEPIGGVSVALEEYRPLVIGGRDFATIFCAKVPRLNEGRS